ncbi:MAG: VOC family protein [Sphingomicrobium sp.]
MDRTDNQGPSGGITPHITIRDRRAAEAIEFYTKAFGAEEQMRHPTDDGRLMHAHLKINGGSLMLHDDFPEHMGGPAQPSASLVLHLDVTDADSAWQRALDAGAQVRFELADQFWGDRYGQVSDPFGFIWSIGAPVKQAQHADETASTAA